MSNKKSTKSTTTNTTGNGSSSSRTSKRISLAQTPDEDVDELIKKKQGNSSKPFTTPNGGRRVSKRLDKSTAMNTSTSATTTATKTIVSKSSNKRAALAITPPEHMVDNKVASEGKIKAVKKLRLETSTNSGDKKKTVANKTSFINNNGAIIDLRSPVRPPQVIVANKNANGAKKGGRVTESSSRGLVPRVKMASVVGSTTKKSSLVSSTVKASPKAMAEKEKPVEGIQETPKQPSPCDMGAVPDFTTAGEVYWAAAPASKYFRVEGNSSHQNSPVMDLSEHVDSIMASLASTSSRLPRYSSNKADPPSEYDRHNSLGRSLSIPKLPRAAEMVKSEPRLDPGAFLREAIKSKATPEKASTEKNSVPKPVLGPRRESSDISSVGRPSQAMRGLTRFHSVPAHIHSNGTPKESDMSRSDLNLSSSFLDLPSLNSSSSIVHRFDLGSINEESSVVPERGTSNPFYSSPTINTKTVSDHVAISLNKKEEIAVFDFSLDDSMIEELEQIHTQVESRQGKVLESSPEIPTRTECQAGPALESSSTIPAHVELQVGTSFESSLEIPAQVGSRNVLVLESSPVIPAKAQVPVNCLDVDDFDDSLDDLLLMESLVVKREPAGFSCITQGALENNPGPCARVPSSESFQLKRETASSFPIPSNVRRSESAEINKDPTNQGDGATLIKKEASDSNQSRPVGDPLNVAIQGIILPHIKQEAKALLPSTSHSTSLHPVGGFKSSIGQEVRPSCTKQENSDINHLCSTRALDGSTNQAIGPTPSKQKDCDFNSLRPVVVYNDNGAIPSLIKQESINLFSSNSNLTHPIGADLNGGPSRAYVPSHLGHPSNSTALGIDNPCPSGILKDVTCQSMRPLCVKQESSNFNHLQTMGIVNVNNGQIPLGRQELQIPLPFTSSNLPLRPTGVLNSGTSQDISRAFIKKETCNVNPTRPIITSNNPPSNIKQEVNPPWPINSRNTSTNHRIGVTIPKLEPSIPRPPATNPQSLRPPRIPGTKTDIFYTQKDAVGSLLSMPKSNSAGVLNGRTLQDTATFSTNPSNSTRIVNKGTGQNQKPSYIKQEVCATNSIRSSMEGSHLAPPLQPQPHIKSEHKLTQINLDDFSDLDDDWDMNLELVPKQEITRRLDPQSDSDSDSDYAELITKLPKKIQMATTFTIPGNPQPPEREILTKCDFGPPGYYQCLVVEIQFQYYPFQENGLSLQKAEKMLRLYDQRCGMERVVHLRESWIDTKVDTGDCVNVIGEPTIPGTAVYIINDDAGYLVLNPNMLLSPTHLADSFSCLRRATLSSRLRTQDDSDAKAMIFGNILHTLLQQCMLFNRFDQEFLDKAAGQVIRDNTEGLYMCDIDETEAENCIQEGLSSLQNWAGRYVGPSPRPEATYRNGTTTISVRRVLGVEETIISPMFGLKGKIDATILTSEGGLTQATVLELKTGRANHPISHRAQVLLYLLMMSDRYQVPIVNGWIMYLKGGLGDDMMTRVDGMRLEVRGLVQARNNMTTYLVSSDASLPSLINNPFMCKSCPVLNACATYHCAVEGGTSQSTKNPDLYKPKIDHLTLAHQKFFRDWERLLTLEEGRTQQLRQQIWLQSSDERSKSGDCLNEMIVLDQDEEVGPHSGGLDLEDLVPPKWYVTKMGKAVPNLKLPRTSFGVGEPIVVSTDAKPRTIQHVGLAIGFVREVHPNHIVLALDRQLKGPPLRGPNFHPRTNQVFEGERDLDLTNSSPQNPVVRPKFLYRIDKDEITTGMLLVRNNLVELMVAQTGIVAQLRSLVVDLVEPTFRTIIASSLNSTQPSTSQIDVDSLIGDLNADQQLAMKTVLSAQNYTLILGMPGTGKTTTIARMVQLLVQHNRTVLVAAHTHSAVDNILCKLLDLKVTSFLRIGNVDKVHPKVQPYTPPPRASVATLRRLYDLTPIIATTCLSISHRLFQRRSFDCCIIDEASQVTLPICIGPLRFARRFVLVGDHYQLPPLVRNSKAKVGGLGISLFKRLSEAHLQSVVHLRHQYRMNQDIMDVANLLVYQEALRCGTHAIATSTLPLPNINRIRNPHCSTHSSNCWILHTVDPSSRVVFLDTDNVPAHDEKMGELTSNPTEVSIVAQLVQALVLGGVSGDQIGIISPYRNQLNLLGAAILPNISSVEILTIDRAQGRDKDCIIISMVRSNPGHNVGDLLRDWRRINVAFTRARHKLIVVGSARTLDSGGGAVLSGFVKLTRNRNWLFSLPINAHNLHTFPWPIQSDPINSSQPSTTATNTPIHST